MVVLALAGQSIDKVGKEVWSSGRCNNSRKRQTCVPLLLLLQRLGLHIGKNTSGPNGSPARAIYRFYWTIDIKSGDSSFRASFSSNLIIESAVISSLASMVNRPPRAWHAWAMQTITPYEYSLSLQHGQSPPKSIELRTRLLACCSPSNVVLSWTWKHKTLPNPVVESAVSCVVPYHPPYDMSQFMLRIYGIRTSWVWLDLWSPVQNSVHVVVPRQSRVTRSTSTRGLWLPTSK